MKHIIVAYDLNHAIGYKNRMPWEGTMPADMRHFKTLTTGHAIIMGSMTYQSIGRPLPRRLNIVLSRRPISIDGCLVASSIEEAFELAKSCDETFVIGGGKVYQLALPYVETIIATEIDFAFENTDTHFYFNIDELWEEDVRDQHIKDSSNQYDYSFVTYKRKHHS